MNMVAIGLSVNECKYRQKTTKFRRAAVRETGVSLMCAQLRPTP